MYVEFTTPPPPPLPPLSISTKCIKITISEQSPESHYYDLSDRPHGPLAIFENFIGLLKNLRYYKLNLESIRKKKQIILRTPRCVKASLNMLSTMAIMARGFFSCLLRGCAQSNLSIHSKRTANQ